MADERKQKYAVPWPRTNAVRTPAQSASHRALRGTALLVVGVILLTGMWIAGFYVGRDSLARQIAANFSDEDYYLPVDSQQLTVQILPLIPGEQAAASLTSRDSTSARVARDLSSPAGLEGLAARLAEIYPLQFEVGAALTIPDEFYSVERQQFRADQVLDWLVAEADSTMFRTIGVMPTDIYQPGYNFLFGLAKLGGNSCVASCARMGGRVDNARLTPQQRWSGIASHELGHTLGLRHVEDTNSLMAYADSLQQLDAQGFSLTKADWELLRELHPIRWQK